MNSKQVVFITYKYGFPNGMASTQRTRLLSKGLVENGIKTTVFCVKAIERQPIINIEAKGYYQGAYFEYTPGTTARPNNFLKRRWLELRGLIVAIFKLISLKAKDEIYCIFLCPTIVMDLTLMGCIYRILAMVLKIPLILEVVERPWSLKDRPSYLERKISPTIGATGVIVISDFLLNWVQAECKRTSKKVHILYIPSMVDPQEAKTNRFPVSQDTPKVLFAGSPVYDTTIQFIIKSMRIVIDQYPQCQLIISGCRTGDPLGIWVQSEEIDQSLREKIILAGYLPRKDLLALFQESNALLIPLFDDIKSKARFPIKLVEYLLSGRPVVTTKIGDIPKYLENNWNAYICEPGDPNAFAELIIKVLNNPVQSNEIGQRGKEVAYECFDYSIWVKRLSEFIVTLK